MSLLGGLMSNEEEKEDDNVVLGSDELEAANAVHDQVLIEQEVQIPYEIELDYDWDAGQFQYTLRTGQMGEIKSSGIVEPTNKGEWDVIEQ